MKTLSIILMLVIGVGLFSCNKMEDDIAIQSQDTYKQAEATNNDLSKFVQGYFEKQYHLMYGHHQLKSAQITNSIYSIYKTKEVADKHLDVINWNKWGYDQRPVETKYTNYKIYTKIKDGSLIQEGNLITFKAYMYYESYFPSYSPQVRKHEDFSAGVGLYSFTIETQENGYVVVSEVPLVYDGGLDGMEFGETIDNEQIDDNEHNWPLKNASATSYSPSRVVSFATKYYSNLKEMRKIYKNYCDYSDYGGDCTNFLSFCLLYGYWPQNDNWFFNSKGTSGNNMKKYTYSPSWTGARYFYWYITSSKPTYPNSDGSNRVSVAFSNLKVPTNKDKQSTWDAFYSKIRLLKAGDILEIGDGGNPANISHNMVVTSSSTKYPYILVTFRNATGYGSHEKNYGIDKFTAGTTLYGFNVKSKF